MNSAVPVFNELAKCFKQQVGELNIREVFSSLNENTSSDPHFLSFTIKIPKVDPLAVLEQHGEKHSFQYYWEKPSDEFAIAAAGSLARIQSTGLNRFKGASTEGKELLSRVHHSSTTQHHQASVHLLGGFSFFDHNIGKDWRDFGAGSFNLPEWVIVRDGQLTLLTLTLPAEDLKSITEVQDVFTQRLQRLEEICKAGTYTIPRKKTSVNGKQVPGNQSPEHMQWNRSIRKATDLIKADTFKKIVLARELKVSLDKPVSDTLILNHLRQQYPDCYSFLIRQNISSSFIGCTPERLASFKNRYVLTEGLAGSTSRGKTASEDALLEHELLNSKKDLSEHAFVLDAIEESLERFSDVLEHPDQPGIKKLSNVQHLYTPVRAKIKNNVSRTEVLSRLHPTPAVGGYPREEAVPYIHKLENFDRGWYAAPVGWINANGEGEFAVAIRSGLIKDDEVRFFAGCGIVEDSDPDKEWEETNLKFIPMLTALEYARN